MSNTKIKSSDSEIIKCKAVVCWSSSSSSSSEAEHDVLKLEEIQVDPPKASEVRIKILYASVCHTDISCIHGFPAPTYPRVLGHEGVGVVESVGDEVKDLKEGDVVIPTYVGECKECENCASGISNLCLKYPLSLHGLMLDNTSRMSIRGQVLYHTFSCATWTWKDFKVEKGSTVAVFGLGAVGLGVVNGAKMRGAAKIIGIDKNPWKKHKGEAFGMTDFINPSELSHKSISELVKERTDNETGVDYSFECSGAKLLAPQAIEATKWGKGKTMLVSSGIHKSVEVDVMSLLGGRTFKGTIAGGLKNKSDLPILFQKCKNKEFELDELLTHEITLEETNKITELLKQPDCVKILIKI